MPRLIEILKSEELTVVHKSCGAKIGYYENETKSAVHEDYGGGRDTWYYIICPNCNKRVEVKSPR
jgi:hypothetical protein